jgi:hypothetical protein
MEMCTRSLPTGKVLWDGEEKLKHYLASMPGDDESAVEKWGALLKWWHIVERSFSVMGVFAHLCRMRKQAEKYDRLGKFLLRFPRFVFQLQLLSLADWQ